MVKETRFLAPKRSVGLFACQLVLTTPLLSTAVFYFNSSKIIAALFYLFGDRPKREDSQKWYFSEVPHITHHCDRAQNWHHSHIPDRAQITHHFLIIAGNALKSDRPVRWAVPTLRKKLI